MKKPICALAAICFSFVLLWSCSKSSSGNGDINVCDAAGPKTFAADVNPIIQTFCNQPSCHNPGSVNGPGSLTNYNEVFNARSAIRAAISSGLMPKNATLSTTQRNSIICWIDNGSLNN